MHWQTFNVPSIFAFNVAWLTRSSLVSYYNRKDTAPTVSLTILYLTCLTHESEDLKKRKKSCVVFPNVHLTVSVSCPVARTVRAYFSCVTWGQNCWQLGLSPRSVPPRPAPPRRTSQDRCGLFPSVGRADECHLVILESSTSGAMICTVFCIFTTPRISWM